MHLGKKPCWVPLSGVLHVGISDHGLVYASRKLSINQVGKGHTMVSFRKFKPFNSCDFRRDISMQDWGNIDKFQNPKICGRGGKE